MWFLAFLPSLSPAPGGLSAAPAAVVGGLGFLSSFSVGGCLWLVLFLFRLFAALAWWPGLWLAAGFGLGGLCRVGQGGRLLRLACSCRSALMRSRLPSRAALRLWAGGCGCGPALPVRRSGLLAVCRFRLLRSRWPCLPACPLALRVWRCLPCRLFLPWRCWVFSSPGVVAVAGSRVLPASCSALVVRVASALASSGASFAVGCCSGADAALLSAVPAYLPPSLVRCFAAFGPGGQGSGRFSAVATVQAFTASGGSVQWWAGGPASLPLRVRLASRTRAVVSAANSGLVVFFGSPGSRGSLLACRCAAARGLPVVAFPVGFSGSKLPSLGAGSWVPFGGFGGFKWLQKQEKLFTKLLF